MDIDELLEEIGIDTPGEYVDDYEYYIEFPDYDAFSEAYLKLYRSDLVVEEQYDSRVRVNGMDILYTYTEPSNSYDIHMEGDMQNDVYTLDIKKV